MDCVSDKISMPISISCSGGMLGKSLQKLLQIYSPQGPTLGKGFQNQHHNPNNMVNAPPVDHFHIFETRKKLTSREKISPLPF